MGNVATHDQATGKVRIPVEDGQDVVIPAGERGVAVNAAQAKAVKEAKVEGVKLSVKKSDDDTVPETRDESAPVDPVEEARP